LGTKKRTYLAHHLLLSGTAMCVQAGSAACLEYFVGSSPAVAMEQEPNLQAAGNRWHSLWLPVALTCHHLHVANLNQIFLIAMIF
jgi:hypothetical protein